MPEWREFNSREALDAALAAHIAGRLREAVEARGSACMAVSGGSTPKGLFARLSAQQLPWQQVWITLVDERWVKPDHVDSNERLVREHLLRDRAVQAHFTGLKTGHKDARDGLEEASGRLRALPLPFTCTVLGMGGDGHTASWFPRAENLRALQDPAGDELLGACDPVTAPHQRITLTLPVVLASDEIILHITGEDKRAVLAEAADRHYPVAAITEQQINPATIWWAP